MASETVSYRLLAGPAAGAGAEPLPAHLARLGPWQSARLHGAWLVDDLDESGVLGRGGAGFPVGRKWRAIADRSPGGAVVLVNGAEGEPRSHKDRILMTHRPHLVLDGAMLAAEAIGARTVVVYVGEEHVGATAAIRRAVEERTGSGEPPVQLVRAPIGYVAGEASAAVQYVDRGIARPTSPPRPSERGVGGRPTLVQNVESLAYAALIARFGAAWYREPGREVARGTALVTAGLMDARPVVRELELGTTVGELAAGLGLSGTTVDAVLVGGYFGTWSPASEAWAMPLDPTLMTAGGLTFGCGMVTFLPAAACGVTATAGIMGFMARGSARQCGPCLYGLAAIAEIADDLAACRAGTAELDDLDRLLGLVAGRGACHHPDGAAQLMASALRTFDVELGRHARLGRCSADRSTAVGAAAPQLQTLGVIDRVA